MGECSEGPALIFPVSNHWMHSPSSGQDQNKCRRELHGVGPGSLPHSTDIMCHCFDSVHCHPLLPATPAVSDPRLVPVCFGGWHEALDSCGVRGGAWGSPNWAELRLGRAWRGDQLALPVTTRGSLCLHPMLGAYTLWPAPGWSMPNST